MLRQLFYLLLVKPLVLILLGINARGREHLPLQGPAIIVANHNSHLDALALMSLFPQSAIPRTHPVAAADYFCTSRWLKWLAEDLVGIIPIERQVGRSAGNLFTPLLNVLEENAILILFPEGTRGEPESLGKLKNGIAHILSERPEVPVIPVFFYGLGRSLPKGEFVLIPFFIDAFIGEPLHWNDSRQDFMTSLNASFAHLHKLANRLS
jgi:1-acyl-sn-glycerol-3-phosphate acyltransferase